MDCNGSSFPRFSIPSLLRFPDDVAKFFELLCSSSGSHWAGLQSGTSPGIVISARVVRGVLGSRLGFLELEVI